MSRIVGKKLRETREAQHLTLEQAANATHIRLRFLQEMERGNFSVLASKLQAKGFLRAYADFLGLDAEPLIEAVDIDPWAALATFKEEPEFQVEEPSLESRDSASNFSSLGQTLQSQRELLGLSLHDVEQHTHLRLRYLQALESGNIEALPSSVQGRGMLKNYAAFLGLDPDELLLRFAEGLQAQLRERPSQPVPPRARPPTKPINRRRFLTRDVVLGGLFVVSLIAFLVWGASQISTLQAAVVPTLTAPPIAEVLLPSPTATLVPTHTPTVQSLLDPENPNAGESAPENAAAAETQSVIVVSEGLDRAVQVQVVVRQRAWMRITVDEKVEFDGRVIPGSAYAFAGEDFVEISTGNGAGLQVIYNNQDLGVLGVYGQVVNFVITVNGVQTPTPTLTLTPTETPPVSQTPTPTLEAQE